MIEQEIHARRARAVVQAGRGLHTSDCHYCHTPLKMGERGPEPNMNRMLSGHPQPLVMPPLPKLPVGPWQVVPSATCGRREYKETRLATRQRPAMAQGGVRV